MLVIKKSPEAIQAVAESFVLTIQVDYRQFFNDLRSINKKINNLEKLLIKLRISKSLISKLKKEIDKINRIDTNLKTGIILMLKTVKAQNFIEKGIEFPNYRDIMYKFSLLYNVPFDYLEKKDSEFKVLVLLAKDIQDDLKELYRINDNANNKIKLFEKFLNKNKLSRTFMFVFNKSIAVINGTKNDLISEINTVIRVMQTQKLRPSSVVIPSKKKKVKIQLKDFEDERKRILRDLTARFSKFESFALSGIDDRINEIKQNSMGDFKAITSVQQRKIYATILDIFSQIGLIQNRLKRIRADYDRDYLVFDKGYVDDILVYLKDNRDFNLHPQKGKILQMIRMSHIPSKKQIEQIIIGDLSKPIKQRFF